MRIWIAVAAAAVALAGSLAVAGVALRPAAGTPYLDFAGARHEYRVTPPASGRPHGLLIVLHGYTWEAGAFEAYTGLDAEARRDGLLAVYPQGFDRSWNAGACCGEAAQLGLDDIGFVAALAARLDAEYGIDSAATYAAGFSNGAMLALRIACERPRLLSAIAAVSGALEVHECAAAGMPSTLLVHGSADPVVRFPGFVAGTSTTVFDWARARAGCQGSVIAAAEEDATRLVATGCQGGKRLAEYELAGVGHEWTPATAALVASFLVGQPLE